MRTQEQALETEDSEPRDIEALRRDLIRRLMTLQRAWRNCRPACKRARACRGDLVCLARRPTRVRNPKKEAATLAAVQKALKRRLAEIEANGEGAEENSVHLSPLRGERSRAKRAGEGALAQARAA